MPRDYLKQALALLPRGFAWWRGDGPLRRLLQGMTDEFARIDADAVQLLDEAIPGRATADWLLPDWEAYLGLPRTDPDCPQPTTEAERQALVGSRYTDRLGHSKATYLEIAEELGYTDAVILPGRPGNLGQGTIWTETQWRFVWRIVSTLDGGALRCRIAERLHRHQLAYVVQQPPEGEMLIWGSTTEGQRWGEGKWGNALAEGLLLPGLGVQYLDRSATFQLDGQVDVVVDRHFSYVDRSAAFSLDGSAVIENPVHTPAITYVDRSASFSLDGSTVVENPTHTPGGAPTPIAVWDWTPTTYAGVDPAGTATYRWDMQDTSGDLTESIVGGGTHDLSDAGGGVAVLGQTAPGFSDGSNLSGRKCAGIPLCSETQNANWRYESASQDTLDASQGSIALAVVIRVPTSTVLNGRIAGNEHGSNSDGWRLGFDSTNGRCRMTVDDGASPASALLTTGIADGAWHVVLCGIDWTNDLVWVRSDLEPTAVTTSITALTQSGADSGASSAFSLFTTARAGGEKGTQIADVYGWEGSPAEDMRTTSMASIWPYFADPLAGTAFEDDTISYTGVVAVPTSGEDGTFYLCSGDAGQHPVGYDARFVDSLALPNGFARWEQPSMTNLVVESEHLETGWTTNNATVSAAAADLADNRLGFRAARRITASAANGYIESPSITVVNGEQHQLYCWVAGAGGTVTGRLIAYDNSGAAETGSQAFSAGDGVWTLVKLEFTAASTDYRVRIEVDNNTEAINCCHVTLFDWDTMAHSYWGCPIPTYGASATTDSVEGASSLASGEWPEDKGTVLVSTIAGSVDSFHRHFEAEGTSDQILTRFRSGGGFQLQSRTDGADSPVADSSFIGGMVSMTASDPVLWHYVWDSTAEIDSGVYDRCYWKDGTSTDSRDGNGAGWTSGDGVNLVRYGAGTETAHLMGLRGYGAVYDQPYLDGEL